MERQGLINTGFDGNAVDFAQAFQSAFNWDSNNHDSEKQILLEFLKQQGLYNAGLYLRLSKDDDTNGDSASIQTQRMMLEKFCHEQGFTVFDVYIDDGYSGLNFNRPDFQRMLTDIENGNINLVITKDLSRLGRDYIQTGYYTEIYFPNKKVRYIAVNDGVDTNKSENDIAPFKNILNDMYAKDLSRKVKSAKRQRMMNGYFISSQTPYGYKQHPSNKNQLIIDEEAAETVHKIFQMAVAGIGVTGICKALTKERILIPSAYKAKNGDTRFERYSEGKDENYNYTWCIATVQKIMKDRVYVGDMVNGKYEVENYKTKKRVPVPKEKHIIVENKHCPIISREDFNKVQELIKSRQRPSIHNFENIFRSILFCSECGRRLSLAYKDLKSGRKTYYRCMHHFKDSETCKHYHYIYYEDLYEIVSAKLNQFTALIKSDKQMIEAVQKKEIAKNKVNRVVAEKAKIEKRLSALSKIIRKLYEDYAAEMLDGENYQSFLQEYQQEQKLLSERLNDIKSELDKKDDFNENFQKLQTVIEMFLDDKKLSANMINRLMDRIEIGYPFEIDGERQQEVNIVYRFIGTSLETT